MTLQSQQCICDTACSACQVTSPFCNNCTVDNSGVTTACYSCTPGYELSFDGVNCSPCPKGCATCAGGVCKTCVNTFILKGTMC